jgi:hypothetical protein
MRALHGATVDGALSDLVAAALTKLCYTVRYLRSNSFVCAVLCSNPIYDNSGKRKAGVSDETDGLSSVVQGTNHSSPF